MTAETDIPSVTLFVSPDGSDTWSGTVPARVAATSDGPLATLTQALAVVRAKRQESETPVAARIVMRGGLHVLPAAISITPEDSGTREHPLIIEAHGDEVPILSGGRRLTDWREQTRNGLRLWVVDLPDVKAGTWFFTQFFVDDARCSRTRVPEEGLLQVADLPDVTAETRYSEGQNRFVCHPGDVRAWHNLEDVEMISLNYWIDSHMRLQAVDPDSHLVTLDRKSDKRLTDDYVPGALGWYYLENVFEALCRAGQWYLDRAAGRLYYVPRVGQSPDSVTAVAPRLEQLLRIEGTENIPVRHVHFRGLQFAHNEFDWDPERAAYGQSASGSSAAIDVQHGEGCVFERCAITHTGTYGIEFGAGCLDCGLRHCDLTDLGAGGVKLWHGSRRGFVTDCTIGDGGHRFLCGVGILIGQSSANTILHNHIHHLYYSGISVGWTWGYGPSNAFGNVIEYNHIHDIGQGMLSDMGGIYTLGISTGTRIRFNLFHDIRSRGYGGWAIYTDEGSTDILIEKNIAFRTKSAVFHQHYGRDNIIQNNILALGQEAQIARTRVEPHRSFIFRRNIVFFDEGRLLSGNWSEVSCTFESNLYWDRSGRDLDFGGRTLAQWQRLGFDSDSVIADPHFRDPDHGDFGFKTGAPYAAIGFEPFSLEDVGPR